MPATIKSKGYTARLKGRSWSGDEPLATVLNTLLPSVKIWASDPNPDHTIAKAMVARLGGKVLSFTKPKFNKNMLY